MSLETLSPRFDLALVHRGQIFGIGNSPISHDKLSIHLFLKKQYGHIFLNFIQLIQLIILILKSSLIWSVHPLQRSFCVF